nr:hypothetical protein [Tanacetum cinerariifolium]
QWHRWYTKAQGPVTWAEFTKALLVRFRPTDYEDPSEALHRLKQSTKVVIYQETFERKPFTPNRKVSNPGILGPAPTTRLALTAPKPIRRLSNNKARERREKGLCYYCDDKYTPGHKCSKPQFFMIGDAEETENENLTNDALETHADEVQGEISFHAISETILSQTLRLPERIQNKDVVVLVDGGSTHNFVDQELVNRLGLQVDPPVNFLVVVANREKLVCTGRVRNLSLVVQGCVISTNFFVLPVAACPIVLGVQWLKTLRPIEFDFNNLTIGFHIAGSHHTLQGLKASELSSLKSYELMSICDVALLLQIVSALPQVQPELSPSLAIQKVLTDFCKVFQEPSGLPPPRMKPARLLQPLPILERVWEDINMDFIEGLPVSNGFSIVMVVVDRLSKYAHFIPLKHPFMAAGVAREFITNVVRLHGIPSIIVSDRDKLPPSNRRIVKSRESDFRTVPTMLLYGRLPPKLVPYIPGTASVQEFDEYLQDRDSLLKHLRKNLLNAQDHMKANANHHRHDLEFKEGEFVLVKLQPYRQVSVANCLSVKLSPRPLPATFSKLKEVPEPLEIPSDLQPEKNLEERVITKGKYQPKTEELIKWVGQPLGEATWENKEGFFKTYPAFRVEDNAGLSEVDCYVALDLTHAHRNAELRNLKIAVLLLKDKGNYPRMEENNFQSSQDDGKSSPEIAEEAPKKKARAKGAATSPLPLCPTKKRLKR